MAIARLFFASTMHGTRTSPPVTAHAAPPPSPLGAPTSIEHARCCIIPPCPALPSHLLSHPARERTMPPAAASLIALASFRGVPPYAMRAVVSLKDTSVAWSIPVCRPMRTRRPLRSTAKSQHSAHTSYVFPSVAPHRVSTTPTPAPHAAQPALPTVPATREGKHTPPFVAASHVFPWASSRGGCLPRL